MHWYLKKQDQSVYGPVDLNTLQRWAEDGRITPDDALSKDQKKWTPPVELKDLHMTWMVELPDGNTYGPANVLALREPLRNNEITIFCRLANTAKKEETTVGEALLEKLLSEDVRLRSELKALSENSTPASPGTPDANVPNEDTSPVVQKKSHELRETLRRKDALERESSKWKKMYEDERTDNIKREEEFNDRIRNLRESEKTEHDTISKLQRENIDLEKKHKKLLETIASESGEGSAISQLASLMDAYHELMLNYDNIILQMSSQSDETRILLDSRAQIEKDADDRIHHMADRLKREQEEAETARRRLAEIETTHIDLLRSYRDMNDRFVRLRQNLNEESEPRQT